MRKLSFLPSRGRTLVFTVLRMLVKAGFLSSELWLAIELAI